MASAYTSQWLASKNKASVSLNNSTFKTIRAH
jgi:hypothetical protein